MKRLLLLLFLVGFFCGTRADDLQSLIVRRTVDYGVDAFGVVTDTVTIPIDGAPVKTLTMNDNLTITLAVEDHKPVEKASRTFEIIVSAVSGNLTWQSDQLSGTFYWAVSPQVTPSVLTKYRFTYTVDDGVLFGEQVSVSGGGGDSFWQDRLGYLTPLNYSNVQVGTNVNDVSGQAVITASGFTNKAGLQTLATQGGQYHTISLESDPTFDDYGTGLFIKAGGDALGNVVVLTPATQNFQLNHAANLGGSLLDLGYGGTNVFQVYPNGTTFNGPNASNWDGYGSSYSSSYVNSLIFADQSAGLVDGAFFSVAAGVDSIGTTPNSNCKLFSQIDNTSLLLQLYPTGTYCDTSTFVYADHIQTWSTLQNAQVFGFYCDTNANNLDTPVLTLNSFSPLTTAPLIQAQNAGTNVFQVIPNGAVTVGGNSSAFTVEYTPGFYASSNTGDVPANEIKLVNATDLTDINQPSAVAMIRAESAIQANIQLTAPQSDATGGPYSIMQSSLVADRSSIVILATQNDAGSDSGRFTALISTNQVTNLAGYIRLDTVAGGTVSTAFYADKAGIQTADPVGHTARQWLFGEQITPAGVTNLVVSVNGQNYRILATPIP